MIREFTRLQDIYLLCPSIHKEGNGLEVFFWGGECLILWKWGGQAVLEGGEGSTGGEGRPFTWAPGEVLATAETTKERPGVSTTSKIPICPIMK